MSMNITEVQDTAVGQIYQTKRNETVQVLFVDEQVVFLRSKKERRNGGNVHHIIRRNTFENNREEGFYEHQPDSEQDMKGDGATDWTEVSYIGEVTRDNLHDAGYETPLDVQQETDNDLLDVDGLGKAGLHNLRDFVQ